MYFARPVYHIPCESVRARACFSNSLSRSLESTAMSARNGAISSPFQRGRARKSSVKRAPGSTGKAAEGKYVSKDTGGSESASVEVR